MKSKLLQLIFFCATILLTLDVIAFVFTQLTGTRMSGAIAPPTLGTIFADVISVPLLFFIFLAQFSVVSEIVADLWNNTQESLIKQNALKLI